MSKGELKPYTTADMAAALKYASMVVSRMSAKGFYICNIKVSMGQETDICLFNNKKCQELVRDGVARIATYHNRCLSNEGIFYMYGCRFTWEEGVIHD